MGLSQRLYIEAKKIIPGGTQLLSKRPEMFLPDLWPAYYDKAKGCQIWDLDGKKYIDTSFMGIGSCILGYADQDINRAVKEAVDKGSMTTLNCPEEVELAKSLCDTHPWAKMVRFARTGGEAVAIAVRASRAATNKDLILVCGYHGWHDWYLSANLAGNKTLDGHLLSGLEPKGVPRGLKGTVIAFNYNDTSEFSKLVKKYKGRIAAVVMEPIRSSYPQDNFLPTIREVTKKQGIVLVFDEITSGWRLTLGGAHLQFKVFPDIAVFAKAMSNGYSMAAIIGRKSVMEAVQDTFISSTYWTERIGPVAALATIAKLRKLNVPAYLNQIGKTIQRGWKQAADKYKLNVIISGIYPLSHFSFNYLNGQILKTLFTQIMLEKGFLATSSFYVSFAHKSSHCNRYLAEVDEAFYFIKKALEKGNPKRFLKSRVCHSGFKRLA